MADLETQDESKQWYKSKTIWGSLVAGLTIVGGFFNVALTQEEQVTITEGILSLVGLGGSVLSIVGRVKANRTIGK